MPGGDFDRAVRLAAFDFLAAQTSIQGDVLPWKVLSLGFPFHGQRVPLLGPQGIFKPALLPDMPLSIACHRTAARRAAATV
jgi:putative restriction endonuclease